MNIFIKSFNRPYYLDRCLFSIVQFVESYDKIYVLDDGTPDKYLDKLKTKYPEIIIIKSEFHQEKSLKIKNFLEKGDPIKNLKIPSKFWKDSIKEYSGSYFVLLEDDMWFMQNVDLRRNHDLMELKGLAILKFFHFKNDKLVYGKKSYITDNIIQVKPKLLITNPFIFKNLLIRNPLKIFSLLIKSGIVDHLSKIKYYTIYNVAGCIFCKNYYNYLWQDVNDKVDEDLQLIKAVEYHKNSTPGYAYTQEDVIYTSFSSSATNMFSDIDFNVFQYNHILNEEWFNNKFDTCQNLDADISADLIRKILNNHQDIQIINWELWRERFRSQYLSVGHQL